MAETENYYIYDGKKKPFKVLITLNVVKIYRNIINDDVKFEKYPFKTFITENIFIGKSIYGKITIDSGNYGSNYNGNTLLLHLGANTYVYIGSEIYIFDSHNDLLITKYHSPIGKNNIPYPYAIDCENNIYLLKEGVIILNTKLNKMEIAQYENPYTFYNAYRLITNNILEEPPLYPKKHNLQILEYYENSKKETLWYHPNAEEHYESIKNNDNWLYKIIFDKPIYIITQKGIKLKISKKDYINIMENFAKYRSFIKITKFRIY